jgi:hypothetical protein
MAAEDDLLQAVQSAPRFGLNAKALILQIAQAGEDDGDAEAAQSNKRQRRGAQAAAQGFRWPPCVALLSTSHVAAAFAVNRIHLTQRLSRR